MSSKILGIHDAATIEQLKMCVEAEENAVGVLLADGHLGYSMPIGGVVAYEKHVSPSGVGYDIGCGNLAIKTDIMGSLVGVADLLSLTTEIESRVSFGIGRKNSESIDSPVFERIAKSPCAAQRAMWGLAKSQLGTVGAGNHYVDILEDEEGFIWIGIHFGSRGFGHRTATGFLNLADNKLFDSTRHGGDMMAAPTLLSVETPLGQDYIEAMTIAGEYAQEGRRAVGAKVLGILGGRATEVVHNHHNFAWQEIHNGIPYWVVRKGATPAFPGQSGFVGGSMGDNAVILKGTDTPQAKENLYSTIHGAGRLHSRSVAIKGRFAWNCPEKTCHSFYVAPNQPPTNGLCPRHGFKLEKEELIAPIDYTTVLNHLGERGIVVRGGYADEAPAAYRRLDHVLQHHMNSIEIVHTLKPRGVVMAGRTEYDPYKD